jgi:cell division protein FtsL
MSTHLQHIITQLRRENQRLRAEVAVERRTSIDLAREVTDLHKRNRRIFGGTGDRWADKITARAELGDS